MNYKLICIVGMAGSGKSTASDEIKTHSFAYLRFGQITLDEIKKRGLEATETNEKQIREALRKEYGMAAFAILNIPKIDELLKESDVVADGLYSWAEYKALKETYGNAMKVIAVFAPPELRYQRLSERNALNDKDLRFRPFTKEEAKSRDFAEIENIEKAGPIAMADFTIVNTGSKDQLKNTINNILSKIQQ